MQIFHYYCLAIRICFENVSFLFLLGMVSMRIRVKLWKAGYAWTCDYLEKELHLVAVQTSRSGQLVPVVRPFRVPLAHDVVSHQEHHSSGEGSGELR